jgi:poly(glycerol-phosphate) alpha-glucosyltransferase
MTPECNLPEGFESGAAIRIGSGPAEIEQGLRLLFACPRETLAEWGANGRRLAAERFSWPQIAGAMKEVYLWLAGGGPQPACVSGASSASGWVHVTHHG